MISQVDCHTKVSLLQKLPRAIVAMVCTQTIRRHAQPCAFTLPAAMPSPQGRARRFAPLRCSAAPHSPAPTYPAELKLTRRHFAISFAALAVARPLAAAAAAAPAPEAPTQGFVTPSGLRFFDFVVGTGTKPQWGDYVDIDYAMYTISEDGGALAMADSTFSSKGRTLFIRHGNGEMVLGLEEALHSMRVGGRRRVIVPPQMGYTRPGLGPIPLSERKRSKFFKSLNATGEVVVFDLEILNIIPNDDTKGYYSDLTPTPDELSAILDEEYVKGKAAGL
jgi:hypothetical protein